MSFVLVLEELGDKVPDSEIEEMISEADSDGDGKVQFNGKWKNNQGGYIITDNYLHCHRTDDIYIEHI